MKNSIVDFPIIEGVVTQVLGLLIEGFAPGAAVGDMYHIQCRDRSLKAEVVALKNKYAMLLPYGFVNGLEVGARLEPLGVSSHIHVDESLLGRVINAFGEPLDDGPALHPAYKIQLHRKPFSLLERSPVVQRLTTGIRAIDGLIPCGIGQRLGIFAGSGVGKSTILGMLARGCAADVVVLCLLGERGREVAHFVNEVLEKSGLQRSVVVAATSDTPASERVRAAFVATAIAEYFRDQGKHVILFIDSITRFCMAQREIGLAVGEPPTSKGYPPSAFGMLPKLVERVGPARNGGAITGYYTVLVEGDDLNEPVSDTIRGLLDGHIILNRQLAVRGHFPAVDITQSLSRLESDLLPAAEMQLVRQVRAWIATHEDARDLIAVGAYRAGADVVLDTAIKKMPNIHKFLQQSHHESCDLKTTQEMIQELVG